LRRTRRDSPASAWSNYIIPSTVPGAPSGVTATANGNLAITGYDVTAHGGSASLAPEWSRRQRPAA
jgi:hypothetical protein